MALRFINATTSSMGLRKRDVNNEAAASAADSLASERGHDEQDTNGSLQQKRKRGRPRKVSSPKALVRTENEEEEIND
ncbi:unnamed protein product [Mortierella alpina]